MHAHLPTSPAVGSGFSLMEVLIALLVISLGLMGLARAQVMSLQMNHSAHLRSQATFLANDILDRMRANRTAAVNGQYTMAIGEAAAAASSCRVSSCTEVQVAAYDRWEWKQDLLARLPEGDGAVEAVPGASAPGAVEVTVRWRDSRWEDGAAQHEQMSVWAEL